MALSDANINYQRQIGSLGAAGLSALFPKNFEFYMVGIELCDYEDRTIDFFIFPVTPSSISKSENNRTNVKTTSSGVTVIKSDSFIPQDLTIKGDFGRKFKIILNPSEGVIKGAAFSTKSGIWSALAVKDKSLVTLERESPIGVGIKTGYGAHTLYRAILDKSRGVDAKGNPFKLYFYNMALGESYLVEVSPNGTQSSQTLDKNRIWDYSTTFKIIAPLDALNNKKSKTSMAKMAGLSVVQKSSNEIAGSVYRALRN